MDQGDNQEVVSTTQTTQSTNNVESVPHKHARLVLVIVFVVLLAIIGALSYFLVQEKSDESANNETENTQTVAENNNETTPAEETQSSNIPDGFTEYDGDGFSFLYPEIWGEAEVKVESIAKFVGERFYNQSVKYNSEGDYWEYVPQEFFDGEGYASDVSILRKSKDITVWGFGFGDAGCGKSDPVYRVGDSIVQITMPIVCAYEDSVSGTFVEGEVEVNLGLDTRINMTDKDYQSSVDTILDSIVEDATNAL